MEKTTQPGGDDLPFVYSGSMIVHGNGLAKITSTGINTEIGKIGKALESVEEPTRLKKEMGSLVKKLTIISAILSILVIAVYTLTRGSLINGFLAGITLAMSVLPEEFPVILTVFMAIGAWRMSKNRVLTRKPSAIETLGSATVLCTDKTGTLTQNKMTVSRLYNGKDFLTVEKGGEFNSEFHEIIEYGILSSQTNPFDPMEKAIIGMGDLFVKGSEHIHDDWEMIKEYPLGKDLQAMSRVFHTRVHKKKKLQPKELLKRFLIFVNWIKKTIVGAIKMGRRIFDNLQKAFGYTFAIHVPIAGLSLIPILLGDFPIILWPVHIVFLELIIDPACSIIFEAEKEELNIMERPPKRIDEAFFGTKKILFSCLQGIGILLIAITVYFVGLALGYNANEVRTMAFITLIVSNFALIMTNRSKFDNI